MQFRCNVGKYLIKFVLKVYFFTGKKSKEEDVKEEEEAEPV